MKFVCWYDVTEVTGVYFINTNSKNSTFLFIIITYIGNYYYSYFFSEQTTSPLLSQMTKRRIDQQCKRVAWNRARGDLHPAAVGIIRLNDDCLFMF